MYARLWMPQSNSQDFFNLLFNSMIMIVFSTVNRQGRISELLY